MTNYWNASHPRLFFVLFEGQNSQCTINSNIKKIKNRSAELGRTWNGQLPRSPWNWRPFFVFFGFFFLNTLFLKQIKNSWRCTRDAPGQMANEQCVWVCVYSVRTVNERPHLAYFVILRISSQNAKLKAQGPNWIYII